MLNGLLRTRAVKVQYSMPLTPRAGTRRFALVVWPALICALVLSFVFWPGLASRTGSMQVADGSAPGRAPVRGQAGLLQATPAPAPIYSLVVLEWTTKSEVNTAGFNMYRAESSGGPFTRINRELIPSASDPIAGGHYVYTDTEAIAGRTYYYQLEDVELSGNRTRHDTITDRKSTRLNSSHGMSSRMPSSA